MTFERLDDITRRITNRLAPVTYEVPLSGPLAVRVCAYSIKKGIKPETFIAEAVRAYVGDAA